MHHVVLSDKYGRIRDGGKLSEECAGPQGMLPDVCRETETLPFISQFVREKEVKK